MAAGKGPALAGVKRADREGRRPPLGARLEEELERLSAKLGLNRELRVVWMPNAVDRLSGEVKGNAIYIYEAEEDEALRALRHELMDHLITSRIVKPLVGLVNLLIKSREAEVYVGKEELVEILSGLLG
jgi:hypothetical protein